MVLKVSPEMLEQHKDQLSYFITNQDLDRFVRGASEHVERYGELDDKYKSIYELLHQQLVPVHFDGVRAQSWPLVHYHEVRQHGRVV